MTTEIATLGGGCFWCLEAIFQELKGVHSVNSGYAGGTLPNPSYEKVCQGTTGHAEVVQIEFDPQEISYADLLKVFFTMHDPTTLNRQGHDEGTQYRSVIFYHSPEQKVTAEKVMKTMAEFWPAPLVTQLSPAPRFYPAEDFHKDYYLNNPDQSYCAFVIAPKMTKLHRLFLDSLKTSH